MKETQNETLRQFVQKLNRWADRQHTILDSLNTQVKELKTPESIKLFEAEQEQLYQQSLTEDHE